MEWPAPFMPTQSGSRIYVDPWNSQHPNGNSFRTYFDDPTIISRDITDAWENSRADAVSDIQSSLAERDIGGGFRTYDATVTLNSISDFSVSPSGHDGAVVQFTIPNISIATSFRMPGPAPNGTDPRFVLSGDLVVSAYVSVGTNGKALTASVSAFIRNINGPTPLNDSAKVIDDAADIANAMINFVTGIDFKQSIIAVLSSQDLSKKRLQPLINANLQSINDQYAAIPELNLMLERKLWTDRSRLTLYVATRALPGVPRTGTMGGQITWDPKQVAGNCSDLSITASVQLGPPVLLNSDGVTFGAAPVENLGEFSANPTGVSGCSYTLSGLGPDLPNTLQASTLLGAVDAHSSASPYVGRLHSSTVIYPQGWSGDSVVPNADDRNYIVVSGMSGGAPIGKLKQSDVLRQPNPGDERNVTPGTAVLPGVQNQHVQSPGSKVEINPQPLPPKTLKQNNVGTGQ